MHDDYIDHKILTVHFLVNNMLTTTQKTILMMVMLLSMSVLSGCDLISRFIEQGASEPRTSLFSKGQKLYNGESSYNKITAIKECFGKDDSQRSLGYIIKALDDKDTQVRLAAIETLAKKQGIQSLYFMIKKLNDDDKNNVQKVEEIIASFGESGRDILSKYLNDKNFIIKRNTIRAIGITKDKYFTDFLGRIAIDETDYRFRKEAVEALAKLDSENTGIYIESRLKDRIPKVKEAALTVLKTDGSERIVTIIEPLLTDKAARVQLAAIKTIVRNGNGSGIVALDKLIQENKLSVEQLAEIEKAYAALGDEKTKEYFKNALEDDRKDVQLAILKAAIQKKTQAWAQEVLRYAAESPQTDIKNMALFSLKESRSEENLDTIIAALNDSDFEVRENAIRALSQAPEAFQYEDIFKKMLNDEHSRVRLATVRTLSNINRKWSWQLLIDIINENNDSQVTIAAISAMIRYKSNETTVDAIGKQLLNEDSNVVSAASITLLRLGDRSMYDYYIQALDNENPQAQIIIVKALERIGDKRATGPMRKLLNSPDKKVKDATLYALKQLTLKK